MKYRYYISVIALILFSNSPADVSAQSYADLEEEARSTSIPSAGAKVIYIAPNSQAEALGIVKGDFLVRSERSLLLRIKSSSVLKKYRPVSKETQNLLFVKKDGREFLKIIEAGKIGVVYLTTYRPELAYLRKEIGRRDPKWDEMVVSTFHQIQEGSPSQALKAWKDAKNTGYPEDDAFFHFLEAYVSWANGTGFDSEKVFDMVFSQSGGTIPDAYFPGIERLSFAGNSPETLAKVRQFIPHNNHVEDDFIDKRLALKKSNLGKPLEGGALLEAAISMRASELTEEFLNSGPRGEKTPKRSLSRFFGLHALDLPQRGSSAWPHRSTKNVHVSLGITAVRLGLRGRSGQSAGFSLYDMNFKRETSGSADSAVLVNISFSTTIKGDDIEYSVSGSGSFRPHYLSPPFPISIPMKGTKTQGIADAYLIDGTPILKMPQIIDKYGGEPTRIRIDLIRIDGEAAVFINQVCLVHMPVSEAIQDVGFGIFLNGTNFKAHHFEAWELQ